MFAHPYRSIRAAALLVPALVLTAIAGTAGAVGISPSTTTTTAPYTGPSGDGAPLVSGTIGPTEVCVDYQEVDFTGGSYGAYIMVSYSVDADIFGAFFQNDEETDNTIWMLVNQNNGGGDTEYVYATYVGDSTVTSQYGYLDLQYACS